MDNLLTPGQSIRAPGNEQIAKDLLKNLYGMTVIKVAELNAYDDRNYYITCDESHINPHVNEISEDGYVLKIMNSLDSKETQVIEAQNEMLMFLNERKIKCPLPIRNMKGGYYALESLNEERPEERYVVRLLIYRPGELLHRTQISDTLLKNVGAFAARLDNVLMDFSHPAYDSHKTLWMLTSVPKLHQFTYSVKCTGDRELVTEVILAFENDVLQVTPQLEHGIIHGDLNEQNILVNEDGTDLKAVIDFGDSTKTCLIFELAIAMCYMMLHTGNISAGKFVLQGYQSVRRLTELEKRILKVCVCARIGQSLVLGAYSHSLDPQNDYLLTTQKPGWTLLKQLWPLPQELVMREWGLSD